MTMNMTYSLSQQHIGDKPLSTIPDKLYMVKKGKIVLPVYESSTSMTYREVSLDYRNTTMSWKFMGSDARVLSPYVWYSLRQKRRCNPIYIPLDTPVVSPDGKKLVAFIAAQVDIQEVSITGNPIPKKPKRKNTKYNSTNVWQTAAQPNQYSTTATLPPQIFPRIIPSHQNTVVRPDGFVIFSTDNTIKTIMYSLDYDSKSVIGKKYKTLIYADASVSCNCNSWTKRTPRTCRHIMDDKTVAHLKPLY
jgi:hypothetical protein